MLRKSRSKVTSDFINGNNKSNTKNVKDITTVKVKGGGKLNVTHETSDDKNSDNNIHSSIKKGKLKLNKSSSSSSKQKKEIDLCSS